jgi:hypothetical protein
VDDDFERFGDKAQPTHRMMREFSLSMKAGVDPDADIVLDSGASSHFLTPATADQIELVPARVDRPASRWQLLRRASTSPLWNRAALVVYREYW